MASNCEMYIRYCGHVQHVQVLELSLNCARSLLSVALLSEKLTNTKKNYMVVLQRL